MYTVYGDSNPIFTILELGWIIIYGEGNPTFPELGPDWIIQSTEQVTYYHHAEVTEQLLARHMSLDTGYCFLLKLSDNISQTC